MLYAIPDFVEWYKRRGFCVLPIEKPTFEAVEYTPMELPSEHVATFLGPHV
jgi:hypothetical protein